MKALCLCDWCKNDNRKAICLKGHETVRPMMEEGKRIGSIIGPKGGKCIDFEEDLLAL